MFAIAVAVQSGGLTLHEIISDIPHDGASLVVYLMLLAFVGFIWAGSRKKSV
ncbi:MAG: hypothetical protein KFH98_04140 [Gemmatimonadetes bacterium]|nr:hypothetical protein [Gemmatimonadota bacterium]